MTPVTSPQFEFPGKGLPSVFFAFLLVFLFDIVSDFDSSSLWEDFMNDNIRPGSGADCPYILQDDFTCSQVTRLQ